MWCRGTAEWKVAVGPSPDGPWTRIAEGRFPDPIPLAENETQIPLEITQLSPEIETRVGRIVDIRQNDQKRSSLFDIVRQVQMLLVARARLCPALFWSGSGTASPSRSFGSMVEFR